MAFRLGVLETGRPPEELAPSYPDYPHMVANWLGLPDAELLQFAVLNNQFPASPNDADLWVITGSKFGAYEDLPWIATLEQFIRDCHAEGVPMVGICFGHQIIAQALGGVVEKSDKGWGVGVHEYQPTNWPDALGAEPQTIRLQALHQDQVTKLPPDAQRISNSEFCANAAIWYPGFAVTVQGHPEFGADYAADILKIRRGLTIPADRVDPALQSMTVEPTAADLAARVKAWVVGRNTKTQGRTE